MKFTLEQLEKAKKAKSLEEFLALAKENAIEMTETEAKKYFTGLHKEGILSDDELDNVSGGDCDDGGGSSSDNTPQPLYKPGEIVNQRIGVGISTQVIILEVLYYDSFFEDWAYKIYLTEDQKVEEFAWQGTLFR